VEGTELPQAACKNCASSGNMDIWYAVGMMISTSEDLCLDVVGLQ
jgi:hypothetical protein